MKRASSAGSRMKNLHIASETLEYFSKSGVLPLLVSLNGKDSEPLEEVIIADSISGGADYVAGLPRQVSLLRRTANGSEYRGTYILKTEVDGGV